MSSSAPAPQDPMSKQSLTQTATSAVLVSAAAKFNKESPLNAGLNMAAASIITDATSLNQKIPVDSPEVKKAASDAFFFAAITAIRQKHRSKRRFAMDALMALGASYVGTSISKSFVENMQESSAVSRVIYRRGLNPLVSGSPGF